MFFGPFGNLGFITPVLHLMFSVFLLLILIGLAFVVVRFLLVATRAAQIYIAKNTTDASGTSHPSASASHGPAGSGPHDGPAAPGPHSGPAAPGPHGGPAASAPAGAPGARPSATPEVRSAPEVPVTPEAASAPEAPAPAESEQAHVPEPAARPEAAPAAKLAPRPKAKPQTKPVGRTPASPRKAPPTSSGSAATPPAEPGSPAS